MPEQVQVSGLGQLLEVGPRDEARSCSWLSLSSSSRGDIHFTLSTSEFAVNPGTVREWPHAKPVPLSTALDSVAGGSQWGDDSTAIAGLFEHLADRRLLRRFTLYPPCPWEVPSRRTGGGGRSGPRILPLGVLWKTTPPGRTNESCHGGDSRSAEP